MTQNRQRAGVTRQLAGFCAKLSYDGIPKEVIESAIKLAFDTMGVAAGGTAAESSRIMLPIQYAFRGRGCSALWKRSTGSVHG